MKFRLLLILFAASAFADDLAAPKYSSDKKGVLLLDSTEVTAATDTTPAKVRQKVEVTGGTAPAGSGPTSAATSMSVVPATATTVKSTALESSRVLKNSAGTLVSLQVFNSKASAQYILVMDSATVTGDGAVVLLCPPIYLPATSNMMLNFTTPLTAANGISVSNSSTGSFTKTIGSSDCIFVAQVQ